MDPRSTPSQTIGPFFHDALLATDLSVLVHPDHPRAVKITGVVHDGAGDPVTDALVEIQAPNPTAPSTAFGRSATSNGGEFSFVTLKPGPAPTPGGDAQAPHFLVSIFARGLLKRLVTRMYFSDEAAANAGDPVLGSIADPELRDSLVARAEEGEFRFDVRLQGAGRTAFFEISA